MPRTSKSNKPEFKYKHLLDNIGDNPICYLTR